MQRRHLLTLGLAGTAVLAVGGGVAAWAGPAWAQGRLTPAGRGLHEALMRAWMSPADAAVADAVRRLEAAVAGLPAHTRGEIAQLGALMLHPLGRRLLCGLAQPWESATPAQVLQALDGMRLSTVGVREQAYHGLRQLTLAAWFSDASSWPLLGYPGPRNVNE